MNHWISLSKAHSRHPDGKPHVDVLAAFAASVYEGEAVFLSDSIYFEVGKMTIYRQRRDLREVMEILSGYAVVMSRPDIAAHEVEAMLELFVAPSPNPINSTPYLDWGVARALGRVGGIRIHDTEDGRDVTDEIRESWPDGPAALDARFASAELQLNRWVLDGPSGPEEEERLESCGYKRQGHMVTASRRVEQEIEQVGVFNDHPTLRRGRIRDVVTAREVLIELNDTLSRGLADRGTAIAALFPSPEYARRGFDAMPSLDVAVTIKSAYHQNPKHRWTVNDITDIDALGSTLPYCDVVVTDKAVAACANRTGLAERLGTVVMSRLSEAADYLN